MLGLQPQLQQTRCIFHLYPNGRASYHDLHRARSHAGKSTGLNAPLHASETFRFWPQPHAASEATPPEAASDPRIPVARARAGRAQRAAAPDAPASPPACAASPKTQGSPRPSPERFRRRGRRPRKPPEAVSRTAAMRRGQAKGKAGGFPVGSKAQLSPTSASEQTHR